MGHTVSKLLWVMTLVCAGGWIRWPSEVSSHYSHFAVPSLSPGVSKCAMISNQKVTVKVKESFSWTLRSVFWPYPIRDLTAKMFPSLQLKWWMVLISLRYVSLVGPFKALKIFRDHDNFWIDFWISYISATQSLSALPWFKDCVCKYTSLCNKGSLSNQNYSHH